jgi:hypothetical protein
MTRLVGKSGCLAVGVLVSFVIAGCSQYVLQPTLEGLPSVARLPLAVGGYLWRRASCLEGTCSWHLRNCEAQKISSQFLPKAGCASEYHGEITGICN